MSLESWGAALIGMAARELCFIDIETTGAIFGFHEVIEVAAIRTSADAAVEKGRMSFRLLPEFPDRLSGAAAAINRFDLAAWRGTAQDPAQAWSELDRFAEGCVPVAHNPSFDRAFIEIALQRAGRNPLPVGYHWIGTESIAWPLVKQGRLGSTSLSEICGFLGLPKEPLPHTAAGGAETLFRVYQGLTHHWSACAG